MLDRRLMLSFLDGLITESEKQQRKQIERLRSTGTPESEAAARSIEIRRDTRWQRHREQRKTEPGLRSGIERRQRKAAEARKTSHSRQLFQRIEKIGDQIADRVVSKDPNAENEMKKLSVGLSKLVDRFKKVKAREKSGAPSRREERKARKDGPDLH
jgi:hypothetical protein